NPAPPPNPFQPPPNPFPPNGPGGAPPGDNPPAAPEAPWGSKLTDEQQLKVNGAIDKGVAYLKKVLDGQIADVHTNRPGGVALGCLTLLSCGVPKDDPVVRKCLDRIRNDGKTNKQTYDLALMILALDRLNDPADKDLIRSMALHLMAGQNASGGW